MSTGNPVPQDPQPKIPMSAGIRQEVKTELADPKTKAIVRAKLVSAYIDDEVAKRTKAATSVMEKIEEAEREVKKVRPTPTGFNASGQPVGDPVFTKEQVDSLKKLHEQLGKLNNALEKALEEGDFTKVFELAGGK